MDIRYLINSFYNSDVKSISLSWFHSHSHRNRNVISVFSQTNSKAANECVLTNKCSNGVLVVEYLGVIGEIQKWASCQNDVFQEETIIFLLEKLGVLEKL